MTKRTHKDMDYPEMAFFMNESKSDVVFFIDGHRVPAIKSILSLKSRVFEAMFSGNFIESKESEESKLLEIEIKDTTVDAFKTMIRFIYTEVLTFRDDNDLDHICDVYKLSDRYEVLRLKEKVGQNLESKINVKDLISISRVVFNRSFEEMMAKVMTFIESNINELIEWNLKELKELNDSTNDKLLDVLTGDRLKSDDNLKRFVVEEKTIFVKKEALFQKRLEDENYFVINVENNSFDAFKTLLGFLYFDKLIIKDQEDLGLIHEVCWMFYLEFEDCISFSDCIYNHLKDRITVENLDSISGIAFNFKINGLIERVKTFIEENFTEICAKSADQLIKINRLTEDSLLAVILKNHQKTIQNNL